MIKRLDWYIIKKYLGTYTFSIILIISISVIFDLTEKIDNFFENDAPWEAIVFDYYLNFIPFFANLFTPLFAFISVIFFTSKMAMNSEIIAILASGISFNRFLRPYFISATLIGLFTFFLSGYVIPPSNKIRLAFEDKYISRFTSEVVRNVQFEVEKGTIVYFERFEEKSKEGYHFSMEKFDGKTLISRMTAENIKWDSLNHWTLYNYTIRDFDGMYEHISQGYEIDSVICMDPADFFVTAKNSSEMKNPELRNYLKRQKERGMSNIQAFEDEYQKRFSMPFSALILTLIGVSLSSRKVRGGMGLYIGVGIALSALYILFISLSSSFAINGSMPSLLAVWLPNIIFMIIGLFLYYKAPK